MFLMNNEVSSNQALEEHLIDKRNNSGMMNSSMNASNSRLNISDRISRLKPIDMLGERVIEAHAVLTRTDLVRQKAARSLLT